jgi:putative spermidine/putrescine transport system permease protein
MTRRKNEIGDIMIIAVAWAVTVFLLAPMLVTFPMSLTPQPYMSMPDGGISFRHYETLATDANWIRALKDSVVVGIGATILSVGIGASAAIGLWQTKSAIARYVAVLPLLPLIIPTVVSALAFSRSAIWFGMVDTYPALIVSHAILGLPFVFLTVSAALENVDKRTVQASRSLGAGQLQSIRLIVLPNIRPGLLSGSLFAFFTSWDEIVVTMFISSRNVFTLPRKIWSDLRENIDPAVAAISAVMIAATLIVTVCYIFVKTDPSGNGPTR